MPKDRAVPPAMRVQDMTEGDPVRLILAFAVPLFIGNIFQQVYSVVDTMVAGYGLGDGAIAAIGATSSLYNLILNIAMGLNSGYAIVVTQRFGAHDEKRLKQSIAGMCLLNGAAALVLTALSLAFLGPLLRFLNTPEAIFAQSYRYIAIICAGMTATIAYNLFAAVLRAVGNSRAPLYFLVVSCLLNILLDLVLVLVLRWGVAGAALATVAAQTVSAVLGGVYLLRRYRAILPGRKDFRVPGTLLAHLLSTGAAMGLMYCVVDMGTVIFQRANNSLGELFIASWTSARRLISIGMQPLGTIATAFSTFVGQNWGAGKRERIRATLKQVLVMETAWSLLACAVAYAFGAALIRFTTGTEDPAVVENAVLSLRCHLTFFPALGVLLCLRMAMQSMGKKLVPVISSCVELAMKLLSAAWIIPHFGYPGTCMTEPVTWTLMMLFLVGAYLARRRELFPPEKAPA
ncbi:MAG: MATE family efflux transporter [Oscillospiraceae bacterium]|nr:MATE family efflux transporter [Oscillospiraceae bacterium]